jgi:hypothetical protein
VNKPQRGVHASLSCGLEGGDRNLLPRLRQSAQLIWMIRTSPKKLLQHKDKLQGQPLPSRVPKNPRVTKYTKCSRGKSNSFAKNVDLGVLSQFPKQHQELLGRERESEI